jgi:hypothetical protein
MTTDLNRIARALLDAHDAIPGEADDAELDRIFLEACDKLNVEQVREVLRIMEAELEQRRKQIQASSDRLREKSKRSPSTSGPKPREVMFMFKGVRITRQVVNDLIDSVKRPNDQFSLYDLEKAAMDEFGFSAADAKRLVRKLDRLMQVRPEDLP